MLVSASLLGLVSTASAASVLRSAGPSPISLKARHLQHAHRSDSLPSGWSYVGCKGEPSGARVLSNQLSSGSGNTPASCAAGCDAAGFSYAGTEYGQECWCGNALNQPSDLPDSNCNIPCTGDVSQNCGAGYTLSLYSKSSSGPAPVNSWNEIGCAIDSDTRVLTGATKIDSAMTPALCQSFCTGFKFAGVESGDECYCGNDFDTSKILDVFSCYEPCAGDSSKHCGDAWRIDIFQVSGPGSPVTTSLPTTTTTSPANPTNPTGDWYEIGCAIDSDTRVLDDKFKSDSAMTPAMCQSFCLGYKFYGLESGDECYCGNSFDTSKILPVFNCYEPCAGDSSKHCGDAWRIDVFQATGSSSTSTSTATTFTITSSPSPTPGWSEIGCAIDSDTRVLTGATKVDSAMTHELCQSFCAQGGFKYAGVESGDECYCDNTFDTSNILPVFNCCEPCAGDASQHCGDAWRIDIFVASGTSSPTSTSVASSTTSSASGSTATSWTNQGCFEDQQIRTLQGKSTVDDAMTQEMCKTFCAGFAYAGVENNKECYCGDQLTTYQPSPATDCAAPCAGDSSEICGGNNWRLTVLKAPASEAPPVSSWNDIGCFLDQGSTHTFTGSQLIDPDMTPAKCQSFCSGYRFAGLENGNECYCANQYTSYKQLWYVEGTCMTPCAGDAGKDCGSGGALDVYQNSDLTPKSSVGSAVGCYVDSNDRILPVNPGEPSGDWGYTSQGCAGRCQSMGYTYSGMEAGNECYCGLTLGSAEKVDDSECNTVCASDPSKQALCGGDWRISVYQTPSA